MSLVLDCFLRSRRQFHTPGHTVPRDSDSHPTERHCPTKPLCASAGADDGRDSIAGQDTRLCDFDDMDLAAREAIVMSSIPGEDRFRPGQEDGGDVTAGCTRPGQHVGAVEAEKWEFDLARHKRDSDARVANNFEVIF